MAFSGSIPHLVNGVSRQVDAMRLPTHVEEQINRFSTPSGGNQRRPAMDHIATLAGSFSGEHFYHAINRDSVERYHVLISNGDLKVFDKNGVQKTVTFPDGKAYLSAASPASMFAAATSADYTFITNKTKVVAFTSDVEPVRTSEALVFVRSGNYDKYYRIWINGSLCAEYLTGDGVDPSGNPTSATELAARNEARNTAPPHIAQGLLFGAASTGSTINGHTVTDGITSLNAGDSAANITLAASLPASAWTLKRYSNVIHIVRNDNAAFTVRCESDVVGDRNSIGCIRTSAQTFSDLPAFGPADYVVRVDNSPETDAEDYWVKAIKDNGNNDNGNVVWKECPKPGVNTKLDNSTMPHVLIRNGDGTFTFKRATWVDRKVGDVPDNPSFVGNTVRDIIFNRGRMAFLTNESVVMTKPNEFFDFWRTTMVAVLDDDPIDVAGTSDNVAIFEHGISFNEDLFLFANQSIHRLTAGDLLTPKSVALPVAVTAQVNLGVAPIATTKSILFMGSGKAYGDVREIFISPDTDESINASVSDHCPGYLPTNIDRIIASDSVNMAFCSATGSSTAYVYQYFWGGNEKLQAAWHKWTLPLNTAVLGSVFFDDELHLLLRTGTTVYLYKMTCAANLFDSSVDWQIKLDGRVLSTSLTPTVSGSNRVFTLPYAGASAQAYRWGGTTHGLPATIVSTSGNTITIPAAELPVVFGLPFTSYLELSRFYMRQPAEDRQVIVQSSDLRLRRVWFHVDKTASVTAYVQPYIDGPIFNKVFTSLTSNDAAFDPNQIILGRGKFSLPVKAKGIRAKIWLQSSTHLPDSITGLEWEGDYDIRARRA